ncbi:MAG: helix-turn-helix domain-containing protein, partial [Actinobacteria bacterium]|nr:helix-turn-helix domain-containing protein [Actinomycetota bacterium]
MCDLIHDRTTVYNIRYYIVWSVKYRKDVFDWSYIRRYHRKICTGSKKEMKNKKDDNYIEIGYKFKIYPTEEQKAFFEKHFGCVRFIYNYLLNLRTEVYKKDKTNISGYEAK